MRWTGHAVRMTEIKNGYKSFVVKPKGKK